jgi:hypothetical protein
LAQPKTLDLQPADLPALNIDLRPLLVPPPLIRRPGKRLAAPSSSCFFS